MCVRIHSRPIECIPRTGLHFLGSCGWFGFVFSITQLSICWTWPPRYQTFICCHHNTFVAAPNTSDSPPTQVLDKFGIHCRFSYCFVYAPHVQCPIFICGQSEGRACMYLCCPSVRPIKKLEMARNHFILRFSVAKSSVSTKSPGEHSFLWIDDCRVIGSTGQLPDLYISDRDNMAVSCLLNEYIDLTRTSLASEDILLLVTKYFPSVLWPSWSMTTKWRVSFITHNSVSKISWLLL